MFLRFCLAFALLLAAAAPRAGAETLTSEQKSAVESLIHDYIVNHPDVLLDALRSAQEDRQAATAKSAIAIHRQLLFADPSSPVGGNPDGDVTIVEFFDYRCPYCKEVEPSLEGLIHQDSDLRIVYKEFPVLGPASVYASRVALAARAQGKYAAFHRQMMAIRGTITDAVVDQVAASVGLDLAKLKADLNSPAIERIIRANYALASALAIQGTPAFIVGDKLIPGATDIATLKRLVADARKGG